MNIFRTPAIRTFALALALPLIALFLAACEVGSVDSTTAVLSDNSGAIYNYSGLYMSVSNTAGSTNGLAGLVYPAGQQSGTLLTWLRMLQYGSALEAYDNAGLTWSGSVSAQNGNVANFSLRGRTTDGLSVEISGTLSASSTGSSNATVSATKATMDATWIEPAFSGSIFAQATVSPVVTNVPTSFKITQSPPGPVALSNKVTLTASGSQYDYIWTGGTSFGTLVVSTNTYTAEYTRTGGTDADTETGTVTSDTVMQPFVIKFQ